MRTIKPRSQIVSTKDRMRLSVTITNKNVIAQIIDDVKGQTLAYSSSLGQKISGPLSTKATWVGVDIAKKAKKAKIEKVIFDRRNKKYHGRVKCAAEAARESGLEF